MFSHLDIPSSFIIFLREAFSSTVSSHSATLHNIPYCPFSSLFRYLPFYLNLVLHFIPFLSSQNVLLQLQLPPFVTPICTRSQACNPRDSARPPVWGGGVLFAWIWPRCNQNWHGHLRWPAEDPESGVQRTMHNHLWMATRDGTTSPFLGPRLWMRWGPTRNPTRPLAMKRSLNRSGTSIWVVCSPGIIKCWSQCTAKRRLPTKIWCQIFHRWSIYLSFRSMKMLERPCRFAFSVCKPSEGWTDGCWSISL